MLLLGLMFCAVVVRTSPAQKKPPEEPPPKIDAKKAYQELLDRAEDEYRRFYKKPEKAHEFWAAMKFEMDTGKFDLAALHLKKLLELPPAESDKDLVNIEANQGMFAFLRLRTVPKWVNHPVLEKEARKNVEVLIERAIHAVETDMKEPERIRKFIKNLDAKTVEERTFAYYQIERSREFAVPFLIEALKSTAGVEHAKIREAMVTLPTDIVPAFLEVFKAADAKDAASQDLRLELLDVVRRRADRRIIPYLWHLSSAKQYPPLVQARAAQILAEFQNTIPEKLTPSKYELINLAKMYHEHKAKFPEMHILKDERKEFEAKHPGETPVVQWEWDGVGIRRSILPASAVETKYALRYAREALDLDPAFRPAQMMFLNVMLDRTLAVDEYVFKKAPPAVQRLLAEIDAELLQNTLEEAMNTNRVSVILPVLEALGQRGEVRAARAPGTGEPRGVVRALYYPDRRVQFVAAQAMLKMPAESVPVAASRIVDILRRFTAADTKPRALIAHAPADKVPPLRQALAKAGFDTQTAATIKQAFEHLHKSADFDVLMLYDNAGDDLTHAIHQLRTDRDYAATPLFLIARDPYQKLDDPKEPERKLDPVKAARYDYLKRLAARHRNTWVLTEFEASGPNVKTVLEQRIRETSGANLTTEERKVFQGASLDTLWRMARGEIAGYEFAAAKDAAAPLVTHPELGFLAIEFLGRCPGPEVQKRLAMVVLDRKLGKLRNAAARELNRHVQKHSFVLTRDQLAGLRDRYKDAAEDPDLREQLAILMGGQPSTAIQSGNRLNQFVPDPPPAKKDKLP